MKICFATNNQNKIKEISSMIGDKHQIASLKDIGCLEELAETQDTIEGNSAQKATYVFDKYQIPCFADDTGLLVDELNGEPGVYSARYAGLPSNSEKNIDKLLSEMIFINNRAAHFKTVITFIDEKGVKNTFEGIIEGEISKIKSGKEGFGYDPIFVPKGHEKTFSEMTLEEKNKISHRAIATKKFIAFLEKDEL
jgi:XTP/dITP diphosphohydrolase